MAVDVEKILQQIRSLLYSIPHLSRPQLYATRESQPYDIEKIKVSESAWVLFTRKSNTGEKVVMKILRDYEDSRYSLKERTQRQHCQCEAVRINREITPGIHLGLARVNDVYVDQRRVIVGDLIQKPSRSDLDETAEYALLMRKLPENRCLERLLLVADEADLEEYIEILIKYIVQLHNGRPLAAEGEIAWGSPEQLKMKLEENIVFVDRALLTHKKDLYGLLEQTLQEAVADSHYKRYFEERRAGGHIKSCHGDLKSTNIWITQYYDSRKKIKRSKVKLLDAIDFNRWFSEIDVLSDLAMLVVDVQARTRLETIAHKMIDLYWSLPGQRTETEEAVLSYYLVEKALISAAISVVHDRAYGLEEGFLEVGKMWMEEVRRFMKKENDMASVKHQGSSIKEDLK